MNKVKWIIFILIEFGTKTSFSQVSISPADTKLCPPFEVVFHNTSKNMGNNIVYEWKFWGDTNFIFLGFEFNKPIKFTKPGSEMVVLKAYDISGGERKVVDLNLADVTSIGPLLSLSSDSLCPGEPVRFNLNQSDSAFVLDYGDGTISPITAMPNNYSEIIFEHRYQTGGSYNATLKGTDQCQSYELTQKIVVANKAITNCSFTWEKIPNNPNLIKIHPLYNLLEVHKAEWSFGDEMRPWSIDTFHYSNTYFNIDTTFLQPGEFDLPLDNGNFLIKLIVTNFCGVKSVYQDSVHLCDIGAPFILISDRNPCPSELIRLSLEGQNIPNKFFWKFDDGTSFESRYTEYGTNIPGKHKIKISYINQCGRWDSILDYITVGINKIPFSRFFLYPKEACPGEIIQIDPIRIDDYENLKILWSFGDGVTSRQESVEHSWGLPGKYPIKLTVFNECGNQSSYIDTIIIKTSINFSKEDFHANISENITCPNTDVTFSVSNNLSKKVIWNFGDGETSTLAQATHQYKTPKEYFPSVKVMNFCGIDTTITFEKVVILENIKHQYYNGNINIPDSVCLNVGGQFMDYDFPKSYLWDFGDSTFSTLKNPYHIYHSLGKKNISLKLEDQCGNDTILYDSTVVINSSAKKIYSLNKEINSYKDFPSVKICPYDTVTFSSGWPGANTNTWSFGDGVSANFSATETVSYSYKFPGTYKIISRPASSTLCGSFVPDTFTVLVGDISIPFTELIFHGTSSCLPVNISSHSASIVTGLLYEYDFGDNSTESTYKKLTTHLYHNMGNYKVTLKISNGCNKSRIFFDTIYIDNECLGLQISNKAAENFTVYPNPSTQNTNIRYHSSEPSDIEVFLINILGEKFSLYKNANAEVGTFEVSLDLKQKRISPGIYLMQLETDQSSFYRKIIVE